MPFYSTKDINHKKKLDTISITTTYLMSAAVVYRIEITLLIFDLQCFIEHILVIVDFEQRWLTHQIAWRKIRTYIM